jgi:hypothetical protein
MCYPPDREPVSFGEIVLWAVLFVLVLGVCLTICARWL